MHDLLLLGIALLPLFSKQNVERFTNETCDITERKIELIEEKLQLETIQRKKFPDKEINERIDLIDEKILELNNKIMKQGKDVEKAVEKAIDVEKDVEGVKGVGGVKGEEEEIYSGITNWNTVVNDNPVFNGLLIFFMVFLVLVGVYLVYTSIGSKGKDMKIDKMNTTYDSILDNIKESKVKKTLKLKKGSFLKK